MANVLKREKQLRVLHLLLEGNSIRSTERLTGIHRDTIMRVLVRVGGQCRDYLDLHLTNLSLKSVQCDEIWTFCKKKQKRLRGAEKNDPTLGDIYLYLALDRDTKLLASFALGKRSSEVTDAFIADLSNRLARPPELTDDSPQLNTDGWGPYVPSIAQHFGGSARHGVLIKNYVNPESGRYAPPDLVRAERIAIRGIKNQRSICTSHVERQNLTIRTFMKRFTRLTLGFSKKLDNLAAAAALHVAFYNYCRVHGTIRCTPAMAAGLTDTLWSLENLFDAVSEHARNRKRAANVARLLRRLRSE